VVCLQRLDAEQWVMLWMLRTELLVGR
jgi:hypothetical protein